jgi:hypothetical protein
VRKTRVEVQGIAFAEHRVVAVNGDDELSSNNVDDLCARVLLGSILIPALEVQDVSQDVQVYSEYARRMCATCEGISGASRSEPDPKRSSLS